MRRRRRMRWGRRLVIEVVTRMSVNQILVNFPTGENVSSLCDRCGPPEGVPGRDVRVFVHRGRMVNCHSVVMQLIEVGVSGFSNVRTGGGLDL